MPGSWMSTEYALKINEKIFIGLVNNHIFASIYIILLQFVDQNVIER